jgi:ABC-type lipoprotein release transport system permease subunit
MVAIEKWVSYLLLFFILAIASFNLISSLSMLVLEKEQSLSTLVAIGMSRKKIGAIFAWESIYVSLIGGISGVILGILLCLGQQHFGWIKLHPESPDAFPYPVEVIWTDVIATLIPVLVIGAITALVTARFAARRSR